MKFIIGSDIHGSYKYASLFFRKVELYHPNKIILLGDCYYNGARNEPPEEYAPKKVVQLLNQYSAEILAVKGNCESEVDQMVSEFTFFDNLCLFAFDRIITCTHGHHTNFDNLPKNPGDIFLQGHTHIGVLEKRGNLILANPGSISLPKDGHHSYLTIDDTGIELIDLLTGNILNKLVF